MNFQKNIISYLLDCHVAENRKFVNKNCEMLDVYNLPIKPTDDNYTKFLTLMFDAEVYNILDFEKMTAEDEEKRINDLIEKVA